ncbi:MAG: LarC family nickel insertion protein [Alphaproteobacteria bacterium]
MKHIHFDPVGGVAGDMIAAALLDAFPEHAGQVVDAVAEITGGEARAQLVAFRDHTLAGHRFEVLVPRAPHEHISLAEIEARLAASALPSAVKDRAGAIFSRLAEAEAGVHGIAPERVTFHEVGALDSIADIVAAATMIEAIGPASYSIGPLPLGSGRIETAHGTLPVPAPAVVDLLAGFVVHDDGIAGERVTPTGAAVIRQLNPRPAPVPTGRLLRRGLGFGTRRLPGLSNVLRILVLEATQQPDDRGWTQEHVALIAFEVDDQSPEDLALGLERVRAVAGVLDVLQLPVTTKKGRLAVQVQVLAVPEARDAVIHACFEQTTTIGLRHALVERAVLSRHMAGTPELRVKVATRPSGRRTAKPESDDLAKQANRRERDAARRRAVVAALTDNADDQ